MRVTGPLDRETTEEYVLILRATDCHHNTQCSDTALPDEKVRELDERDATLLELRVRVTDVNDNAPGFTQRGFRGGVQYDTKVGSRVTRVMARDADLVDEGKLRYYLDGPIHSLLSAGDLGTARQPFTLNSTSGDVLTNIVFLPEWKGSFEFKVGVNDSSGFADSASVSISLLSPSEQVELLFSAPPNSVWDQAHHIIQ